MPLDKRKVFGYIFHASTEGWEDGLVKFHHENGSSTEDGFIPPDTQTTTANLSGYFEIELWCNTGGDEESTYRCTLPNHYTFRFSLPPGASVNLRTLKLAGQPSTPEQREILLMLLDGHDGDPEAHPDLRAAIADLQLTGGWTHRGAYLDDLTYHIGDVVEREGSSYVAIAESSSSPPPNATYWRLVAAKGDPGDPGEAGPPGAASIFSAAAPLVYNAGTQQLSISPATSGAAGTISAADQAKLNGIEANAISTTTGDNRYARTSVGVTQLFGDPGGNTTGIFVRSGSGYAALFGSQSGVAFSAYTSGGMGAVEATVSGVAGNFPAITITEQRYGDEAPGAGYGTRRRVQLKSSTTLTRDAAYFDTVWTNPTDATRTAEHRISLVKADALVEVFRLDHNDSASQAGMLVLHDGTLKRVKVGADGTGPGGSGRALYID